MKEKLNLRNTVAYKSRLMQSFQLTNYILQNEDFFGVIVNQVNFTRSQSAKFLLILAK